MDSLFFGRFSTRHLLIAAGTMAMILLAALVFHRSWLPLEITLPETGVLVAREQPFLKPDSAVPEAGNVKIAAENPDPVQSVEVENPPPKPLKQSVRIEKRKATASRLKKPTVVYKLPQPFQVPVSETAQRWNFVIPTGVKSELFFRGAEFRPGLSGPVKRMILAYDTTGRAKQEDGETPTPGFSSPLDGEIGVQWILAEWKPGESVTMLPGDLAYPIPPGADLVLTVDYEAILEPAQDPWAIALDVSGKAPEHRVGRIEITVPRPDRFSKIGVRERQRDKFLQRAAYTLPTDVTVISIRPHVSVPGVSMSCLVMDSLNHTRSLFNASGSQSPSQESYAFTPPIVLTKDSTIFVETWVENADDAFDFPTASSCIFEVAAREPAQLSLLLDHNSSANRSRLHGFTLEPAQHGFWSESEE